MSSRAGSRARASLSHLRSRASCSACGRGGGVRRHGGGGARRCSARRSDSRAGRHRRRGLRDRRHGRGRPDRRARAGPAGADLAPRAAGDGDRGARRPLRRACGRRARPRGRDGGIPERRIRRRRRARVWSPRSRSSAEAGSPCLSPEASSLWAVALAGIGAVSSTAGALVLLAAAGAGRTVLDVAGRTLLQRLAPPEALGRVFGLLESVSMAGLAVGSVIAPAPRRPRRR